jgi:glycosyltransferase involved in cell wall biosynthesis
VKAGLEVLRLHSEIKFDIIHAHGDIFECLGLYLPSKLLHVPLILTVHGGLNERLVYRRVASLVLSFPNAIIVTSQFIADQAARLGVSQQNVFVISSGVSSMFFVTYREPRVKWSASPLRVVFVGRLHPVKGLSYLLSAVKSLEGQLPIELTLVGDGPERARLEAEARSLPNVHFLGEKQPVEVASLLAQADLFVMPSVDLEKQAEGTPTAVIEAMAAGLPIVCTDAGGLPRLVQHNVNGLVVPQRDPVALARAIWHLATEPELRQAMGKHNCQIARSRDWSVIVEQVEYVYRRAMKPWLSCQSSL